MTINQVRGLPAEPIEEQAVAQYLHRNADFFEHHPQLLARMRLQHTRNGSAQTLGAKSRNGLHEVGDRTVGTVAHGVGKPNDLDHEVGIASHPRRKCPYGLRIVAQAVQ